MTPGTNRSQERFGFRFAVLLCCLSLAGCVKFGGDLDLYRKTNNQPGHEFVKTEQFIVPVGSVIVVQGLEFAPGVSTLTATQRLIVQEVFNSIEEITENTPGDTNAARVAEFKKMQFEIRGFPENSEKTQAATALAGARAKAVMDLLTYLGTPSWRLKAKAVRGDGQRKSTVVFVRTR